MKLGCVNTEVCVPCYSYMQQYTCVLLTAARAMPSDTRPNGTAVRGCIKYGISQSRSQSHAYYMSRLGWWPAHAHKEMNKIMGKKNTLLVHLHT